MNYFFGGESATDDDKKAKKQDGVASDGFPGAVAVGPSAPEQDIPLITDAIVVRDEEAYSKSTPSGPQALKPMSQPPAVLPANNMMVPYQPAHLSKPASPYHNLGRNPVGLQCPWCHRQTITMVQDRMSLTTLVSIVLLAIFFWPLCWLPLCIPACKTTHHYCGHFECRRRVGETGACA
jgi:LITAF-like zinc ribbon domain